MRTTQFAQGRRRRFFTGPFRVRRLAAFGTILALAASVAAALDAPSKDAGLRGILAKEVPPDLGPDAFTGLTGNWEKWGKNLSQMVAKLYTDEKLDVAGQRQLLNQLKKKIAAIDTALADRRFASLVNPLTSLRGKIARRVDVAEAVLDTLELNPEQVRAIRLKKADAQALEALSRLEEDLAKVPRSAPWLAYVRASDLRRALSSGKTDGVIASVESKLDPKHAPSDIRQRNFLSRPAFRHLAHALTKVARLQHPASSDPKTVRGKLTELVAALEAYEDDATAAEAKKVRDMLAETEKAMVDGGERIDAAVDPHYLNYNLQLVASSELLAKLLSDQQTTSGPVSDFVSGATVSGSETTTTNVSVDLEPSNHEAIIDLVLNGVTQSNTVGSTSQASIYSSGYHRWGAVKPLQFDGNSITTGPARISYIQPSTTTTGATTSYSNIPIIGGMANRRAMSEAQARRGEADATAAQRIQTRLLPQVDAQVDQLIQATNQQFQNETKKRLTQAGVLPVSVRARTNGSYLRFSAEVVQPGELAGDMAISAQDTAAGLVVHVHQTLLNNAVRNLKIAGRTMSDREVQAELERYLSLLLGRKIKLGDSSKPAADDKSSMLVFDKEDPIRFEIDNGEINLIIRAGIKQEGQDEIPVQVITVPLTMKVLGPQVMVDRGAVRVPSGVNFVRGGVIKKKIETVIKPMPLDGTIHVPRVGRPEVTLAIANIRAQDGWLSIWAN